MVRSPAALLAALALSVPAAAQAPGGTAAFVNVTVIPMDRPGALPGQTVLVRDGRIVEVGPSVPVPAGAVRIDGAGRYLIPGLAEMHAHVPGGNAPDEMVTRVLALYVTHGITTARGMLGHPRHLELRARVARGEQLGPTIYTSGPSFNGTSVSTPEVGRRMVEEQHAAGYDFLKIHPGIARAAFDTIAATARRLGIPLAGHVPLDVGLERALEVRFASIDHLDGYAEFLLARGAPMAAGSSQFFGLNLADHLDESGIAGIVARTRAANVWNVPTQILMENLAGDESTDALAARPEMRYWYPGQIEQWKTTRRQFEAEPADRRHRWLEMRRHLLKALADGGAGLLLGSDAPQMWNVPGMSTHRELEALVAAGLTPWQALASGTVNVARFFGDRHQAGTIQPGRIADLVLLEADPLADITHTRRIAGVMLRGRWLSRAELDATLAPFAR